MKIQAGRVDAFVARPDPEISIVLLHGPDNGLVGERARAILAAAGVDPGDPFHVTDLDADLIRQQPGRLLEEAMQMSLLGGRRVVRVRQATDAVAPAFRQLLGMENQEALVVVEAGDLPGSSGLRQAVERSTRAAALPCYRDEAQGLQATIRSQLQAHGLRADPDAATYLAEHLGGDRAITRGEIDKLALYVGSRGDGRVRLEDVTATVGDSSALGLEDLLAAVALGRQSEVDDRLARLLGEGQAPARIVRAAAMQFMRLLRMRLDVEGGRSADSVIDGMRPPVHFRAKPWLKTALGRWRSEALERAVAVLLECEVRCKSTGMPDELVLARALGDVAGGLGRSSTAGR